MCQWDYSLTGRAYGLVMMIVGILSYYLIGYSFVDFNGIGHRKNDLFGYCGIGMWEL